MRFDYSDMLAIKKAYHEKLQALEKINDEKIDLITAVSEAERTYSMAKAQATTKLRIEGQPASIIKDLVSGQTANQKFEFEIAKGVLRAHEGNLKVISSKIDALRSFLSSAKSEANIR